MRILIIGGGVAGLAASLSMAQKNSVTVVDPGPLGGSRGGGGLFYIHRNPLFDETLKRWGASFSHRDVMGGVWLKGRITPLKDVSATYGVEWFRQMVLHHYVKTRLTNYGFHHSAMNQGGDAGQQRYDFGLRHLVEMIKGRVRKLDGTLSDLNLHGKQATVASADGGRVVLDFDGLVLTIPLPAIRSIMGLPSVSLRSSKAFVSLASVGSCPDFQAWDYVYTPYIPGHSMYRVSATRDNGMVRVEGVLPDTLPLDVTSVFGSDARLLAKPAPITNAHVFGDAPEIPFPPYVLLLGRYAQWNPRMTMDKALERAEQWRLSNGF